MIHPYWDMALLAANGLDVRPLQLSVENTEDLVGRDVAIVGYPALDPRNNIPLQNRIFKQVHNVKRMQPGKLRGRSRIRSFGNIVAAGTHDSSTLGGNSGSALIDTTTGDIVALHFAGRYLESNYAVPTYEFARDSRVVDAGVNFKGTVTSNGTPWDGEWDAADPMQPTRTSALMRSTTPQRPEKDAPAAQNHQAPVTSLIQQSAATWTVPPQITVRLGGGVGSQITLGAGAAAGTAGDDVQVADTGELERLVEPFHDKGYRGRDGYDECFLGIKLRVPRIRSRQIVSKMQNDEHELPYEHFSVVMHKERRLALFSASNVDGRRESKRPEPGRSYSRRGLSGLRENDQEKWFLDPRIPADHQLPDKFFTYDRGAFDKGHIVRRDDVAWGESYDELRRANGDTYHVTNCSPQVKGFNRSNLRGIWGKLENLVLEQSDSEDEKYSVFAGPVLDPDDQVFRGRDAGRGATALVQIPSRYWKIVVTRSGRTFQTFAFLLEQDLGDVDFELAVPRDFKRKMIRVGELQELLGDITFPAALHNSDQFDEETGESVRCRVDQDD